jgi:Kef-type K+ transport system membrane component KefB
MNNLLNALLLTDSASKPYMLLLPLALILILSKVFAIICKKIGIPQVIGYLVAGLLLGLLTFIPNQTIFTSGEGGTFEGINFFAKIGVVLIMFSAGLEVDVKQIKATGFASIIITSLGVIVPMAFGIVTAWLFLPNESIYNILFYGVILSATSVSITVAVLKEIGKLETKVGSCIVSAAILDDIIGIILLSLVLSLGKSETESAVPFGIDTGNSALNIFLVVAFMIAFFAIAFLVGIPIKKLFIWLDEKWPHHRRIPIFGFALCFLLAYCAEAFFGVADITGAFVAGMIIAQTRTKEYVDLKADNEINLIFGPIFFASIGLMMYTSNLDFSSVEFIVFGIVYVFVGLLGKIIGAGVGGLITKFSVKDSLKIGIGMMARAEVIVVCAQKGIDSGLVDAEIMPFILLLIILSSFITPILLKLLYKKEIEAEKANSVPFIRENNNVTNKQL